MTSRTVDINCDGCGKYMFSLQPNDGKGIKKTYFCTSRKCKIAATAAKLRGEEVKICR